MHDNMDLVWAFLAGMVAAVICMNIWYRKPIANETQEEKDEARRW